MNQAWVLPLPGLRMVVEEDGAVAVVVGGGGDLSVFRKAKSNHQTISITVTMNEATMVSKVTTGMLEDIFVNMCFMRPW